MSNPISNSITLQLQIIDREILRLEHEWDRLDDTNRQVEKFSVESELSDLYKKQKELKILL